MEGEWEIDKGQMTIDNEMLNQLTIESWQLKMIFL